MSAVNTQILFIDSRVANIDGLLAQIDPGYEVVLLNGEEAGLNQIANALQGRTGIEALHVLSHGGPGYLSLGSGALNIDRLGYDYNLDSLTTISQALSKDADILLYGCDVAAGDAGRAFIDALAIATGADVAASTNVTGAEFLGGDWVLEAASGEINTATIELQGFEQTLGASVSYSFSGASGSYSTDAIMTATGVTFKSGGTLNVTGWDVDYDWGERDALYISYNEGASWAPLINTYGDKYLRGYNNQNFVTTYTIPNFEFMTGTTLKLKVDGEVGGWLFRTSATTLNVFTNVKPNAASSTVNLDEDGRYTFSSGAFGFNDPDNDSFVKLKITSLPSSGTLTLNGGNVSSEQEIAAGSLSGLRYTPAANYFGTTSFGFRVFDGYEWSANAYTMTAVVNSVNDAPSLSNSVVLMPMTEDQVSNPGVTLIGRLGSYFNDIESGAGNMAGVVITGTDADPSTEGTWEYYAGGAWHAIDTAAVSATNALALSYSTLIRFNPVADYNGTPSALKLLATDGSFNTLLYATGAPAGGNYVNTLTAAATAGISAVERTVGIIVLPTNDAPEFSPSETITGGVQDTYVRDTAGTLVLSTGTGSAVSGQTLRGTVVATDAESSASQLEYSIRGGLETSANMWQLQGLYGLLTFNASTKTWVYTPNRLEAINALPEGASVNDRFDLKVVDPDGAGALRALDITITGTNDVPRLNAAIENPATFNGAGEWSFQIPANTFVDAEGLGLSYDAKLENGDPLPLWLDFNPLTRTFSGNPTASEQSSTLNVRVYAQDTGVNSQALIDVANDAAADAAQTFSIQIGSITVTVPSVDVAAATTGVGLAQAIEAAIQATPGLSTVTVSYANGVLTITDPDKREITNASLSNGATQIDASIQYINATISDVFTLTLGNNLNDAPTGGVSITGTLAQNSTLTADASSLLDADGLGALTYTWYANGVQVQAGSGAGSDELALTQSHVGKSISVKVSYQDQGGANEAVFSTQTARVANVNDAPALTGTQATLADGVEDRTYIVRTKDLVAGFTDADGDTLSVTGLTKTINSNVTPVTANADGTYSITLPANFNGTVTLNYSVTDGTATTTGASRTFTVDPVNDAPTGSASATLPDAQKNVAYTVTKAQLLQGFSDVDGDALSIQSLRANEFAVVTANGNDTWTITPATNDTGLVTLSYDVIDGNGGRVSATQTYTIKNSTALNFTPLFNADVVWGDDDAAAVTPTANFDDNYAFVSESVATSEGNPGDGLPDDGVFAADSTHPYVDLANFNEAGNNAWRVTGQGVSVDGVQTSGASLNTATINIVNGQYSEVHLFASAGGAGVGSNATFEVTLTYTDASTETSDLLSVPDWYDNDLLPTNVYRLIDEMDRAAIPSGWMGQYDYDAVNDPAIFGFKVVADSSKTLASVTISVVENQTTAFAFFGGTAVSTDTATAVNLDMPVATLGTANAAEGQTITVDLSTLVTDPDTPLANLTFSGAGVSGNTLIFTAPMDANKSGTEVVTRSYTVTDGNTTITGYVDITVDYGNTPPASTDTTTTAARGQAIVLSLSDFGDFTDAENGPFNYVIITALPSSGTLTLNNGSIDVDMAGLTFANDMQATYPGTNPLPNGVLGYWIPTADIVAGKLKYTADANETNTAITGLQFYVEENPISTSPNTVTFQLSNAAPALTDATLAAADLSGTEDTTQTISTADLTQGYTDADGNTLSVTNISASSGTIVDDGVGGFTYVPALNDNGPVTLTYDIVDGVNGVVSGVTRTLNIAAVNDPVSVDAPLANMTGTPGAPLNIDIDLLSPFYDPDAGDTLTYSATANDQPLSFYGLSIDPTTGVISGNAPGSEPYLNFVITGTDAVGTSATSSFTLDLSGGSSSTPNQQYGLTANNPGAVTYTGTPTQGHDLIAQLPTDIDGMTAVLATSVTVTQQGDALASPAPLSEIVSVAFGNKPAGVKSMTFAGVTVDLSAASTPQQVAAAVVTALNGNATWTAVNNNNGSITLTSVTPANQADLQTSSFTGDVGVTYQWQKAPVVSGAQVVTVAVTTLPGGAQGEEVLVTFNASKPNGVSGVAFDGVGIDLTNASTAAEMAAAVTNAINANPAIANWTAIDNGNGTIKLIADTIGHRDDLSTVAVNLGTDPVTLPSFVPLGAWTDVVGTGGYGTTQTLNILQQSESENFVRVQAFYTDAAGVAETPISNVKFVADANDTGTVSISGTAAPGYTLTAILEDADGISSSNPTYQWQSSSSPTGPWGNISGATSSTYTVQTTDANKYLRVNVVSYTDNGGYTQANTASDDVGPIQLGNVAPVAVDDTVTITEHSGDQNGTIDTVSPYSGDLLANDSDANGNGTMSINEVRFGATVGAGTLATDNGTTLTYIGTYGTLTVTKSSGEYTYELDQDNADVQALLPGQQLIEEFNYRVVDTGGLTDRGVLTIYIDGENDLPTVTGVIPASITVDEDVPVLLDLSNAVIDIVDVDGPTVTLKLAVTNGTLRVDTNSGALTVSGYDTNTLTITANSSTDLMNWLAVNDVYYVTGANQNQAVGNYDTLTYSTSDDGGTNYIIQGTTDIVADAVNDALIVDAGGGYVVEGSATVAALATAVTITQQGDAAALPAVPEIVDVTFLAKPANINVLTFAGLTIDLTASTTAMEVATAVVAALVGNADWTAVNNNNGSITLTSVLEQNVADLQLADFQGTVNEIVDILLLPVPATAANPTPLTFDGFTLDLEPGMTIQQIGALFENASFPNWVASINDDGTLRLLAKNQGALDNLNALSFTNNGVASPYVVTSAGNNNVVTFKPRGDAVEIAPKLTVTDVDSGDVSSATVTLVTGVRDNQFGTIYETLSLSQAGQDLADFHGITVLSQPSSSGFVLTLNAPAGGLSSSIYESLLREVLYENSNPNAFAGDRTVQISLSDINGLASNTASISTTEPVAGVLPGQRIFINGADTGAVVTEVLDSMHFVASRSLSLQAGQDLAFYDTVNTPLSGNTTATAVVAGPVVSTVTVRVPWTPVVDNSGTLNTLTNPIGDFDAVGRQYTISYVEQTSAVRIAFDDASITDQGGLIRELKVDLTNPVDNELNGPIKEYLTAPDAAATAYLLTRGIVVTGNGSGVNNLDEATVITFTAANGADATYFQYGLRRVGYVNNDDAMDTRPTPDRTIEVSAIDVDGNTSLNADGTLSVAAKTIINLTPVNDAPNAENSQVTATEDTEFTFTAPDFGFNDNTDVGTGIPGNSLAAIRIDTLPTHGVLKLDGVDVEAGDEIAVANIGNLTYTPDPEDNDNLSAVSFEFSVQDDGDTFNSGQDWSAAGATMTVNITPVNDAPVNTVPDTTVTALPTDEDTGLDITGLQIADLDADEAGVATVTVTLSVDHGELSVAGTGGASGVTAIYSNSDSTVELTGSVADINAVLAATGAVTYLGNQDYNGSDTLTMVTDDGGNTGAVYVALSDTDTVAITINPINDAPVLDTNTAVAVVSTIDEDVADAANVGTTVAALIGAGWITDVDLPGAEPEAMAITAVDNTNGTWQYKLSGGSWADIDVTKLDNDEALLLGRAALVRFVPEANYNGTVTQGLTFRAWDETVGVEGDYLDVASGANIGGIETLSADTAIAEITVNAVNDAPVNTVPADQTVDEDTGLDITGLQIADLDADETVGATVTVTLSVLNGEITVAGTGGAVTAASNGSSSVELTGSVTDINAVLAAAGAVTYQGNQDHNGSDTLTMVTDDGGNTGAVYVALSDTDTVAITINPINDAPVVDLNGGAGGNDNTSGVAFNPRGTAVAIIDPQLTGTLLSDVDTGDVLTEMVVSISEGLRDNLSITYETLDLASGYQLPAGITVVGLGTTTLTFSSTAGDSHANFEEVLRAITYNNTNPNATAGTRTITVSVTDQGDPAGEGAATPLTATATTAVQVNWGAVVDLNGADQAERDFYVNPYTEETGAVFVTDSDAQIVDQDGNIRSVTVTLANPLDNVVDALNPLVTLYQEYLTISSMASVTAAGISVTGNGTGTDGLIDATELTFTALNLAIGYVGIDAGQGLDGTYFQLATRTVQYTNTSQDPDPTMREVVFTSRDMDTTFDPDGNPGVSATTYINVTPVNDLPTIAVGANDGVTGDQTEGVNGDGQALTATDTITVTDVDYTQSLDASVLSVSTTGPVGSLLEADLLAMMAVSPTSVLTASGAGSNRTAAVTWAFDSGAEPFDYLKSTDTLTLTYTVRVTDSESGTADETVTITLTGQNDAPTVLDVLSTSADEGDVSYDVNMLDGASDLDRDETATLSVVASSLSYTIDGGASTPGLPAGLDIITGNTLSVDSEDAAFDDLATGEQRVIVVSYDIEDDTGATVAQTLTVTLTGTNDAPVISVATNDSDVGGETETDGALQITGTLTVNDVDFTDNVTTTVTSVVTSGITTGLATLSEANLLGMLSIQSNDTNAANAGTANNLDWEFDSAAVTAFDYLQDGQRVTLTYTVTSTDDDTAEAFDTHTIAITITGTNDGIVVTGTPVLSADLDELDAPAVGAELTAFGTIEFTDLDLADEHVVTTSVPVGTVGGALTNVEIVTDTTGTGTGGELRWDYAVSAASVEYLGVGDTQVDTFEVTFSDQNGDTETRQIVVTINGTNDAPTITAAQSAGGVTERADAALDELTATLTDQGTIEFADVDLTDTHTATVDTVVLDDQGNEVALPIGALTLGAVDPINKEVQWTFSAFDSELDNLSEGQTLTQVYTITIDDGETGGTVTQEVTITLYGTNDRPAITVTATGDVTEEDSTPDLTDSGAVSVVDPDDLDVQTITTEVVSTAWDDATLSASYTLSAEQEAALTSGFTADQTGWNYQVANDDVQFLGANETVTLTFSVSTQDDSGATNDTDTQNVIITVNGVNDRPSAISDSGGLVINEVVGAGALNPSWRTITTLSAVDADQNDSFTYEVVGGADAAFFRFNPSNAAQLQLTPAAPLDTEVRSSYTVTVRATDQHGESVDRTLTIVIADRDEFDVTRPTFDVNNTFEGLLPNTFPEGEYGITPTQTVGTLLGVKAVAVDADATTNTVSYSLTGNELGTVPYSSGEFYINASTGDISVIAPIDYETGGDTRTVYVKATSADGSSAISALRLVVVNVDEEAPTFTSGDVVASQDENIADGTEVYDADAFDTDFNAPNTSSSFTYSLDGTDAGAFSIDANGVVTINSSPNYETQSSYSFEVVAEDAAGNISRKSLTLTIDNLNDNPVVGPDDTDTAADEVDEDASIGAVVGVTAFASDADAGGQAITYSLSDDAGGLFAIDENTGVVTVLGALDYETAQSHDITVVATSADGSVESGMVTIAVGNVNDNMPVATPPAAVDLAEDAAAGDIAGAVVTATDADGTLNALTFSLVGGPTDGSDNDLFESDPTTGQISLTTAGAAFIDFESTESYTLDVEVTDGANTSTAVQVTVNLVNVNDNTPVATPPAAVDLAEDAAAGDIAGAVVTATDADGTLNPLTFSLVNAPIDGLGNDLFAIDPVTGQISLTDEGAASIDYESADQSYTLDVEASDGTNASTTQVTINLTDVNDNPVVGPDDVDAAADAVDEDAAVGAVVGVTALASDADAGGQTITYSLSNNPGGLFAINEETGVVTVALALDYETAQSHEITVLATSADGSSESGTVTIAVGNVNDNDVMGPHDTDVSDNNVNENVEVGTVVSGLAITASDLDEGGQTITYSLTNDAGGKFAIDSQTGVVTVAGALNYEAEEGPSYTITVEALSADGSVNLEDFTIGVNNMDDQPTGEVIINGAPVQGRELTVTHATLADEDGINTGRGYYYQWFAGTEPIAAANGATLTLGQEQVGKLISVVVRYTDNLGNTNSLSSLQTTRNGSDTVPSLVSNVNDAPTGLPVISGALVQGQTLTASVGTLADLDGLGELSYAWFAGSDAISGATGNTFVLTQDQVGKSITVRASYTDQLGAPEQMISAQSVAVSNVNDLPAGEVTISGTVTQGQTLTAANNLVDVDGMGTVTYQWLANGQSITGATSSTLTLGQDQVGKAITVRAAYTDLRGTNEAVTSTGTAAVANVNDVPTGAITISGTPTQNQTLTVINTLADVDGLGEMSYQWKANGEAISGQTGATLVLGQAQVGKAITVTASYADGQSTPETVTSTATASVANVNDVPTGTVTITGTATQGQTLTAANTLADVDGLGEISYQWKANGEAISGQTGATLVLGQTLVGKAITVTASYTDGQTTAEAVTSNATTSVLNVNDVPTGAVTITGTATQGQTLTAANTLADVDGMGVVSYQWKADGEAISGQTGSTLVLGQTLVGKAITVTASYTDGQSTAEAVTSNATASVLNVNDVPTGAITISGTPTQNQTLTVINTLADVDGLGAMSYQWKANGEAISGQTGATLVLGQAQVGKAITVTASYADGQSTPETVTSTATASVGNVNDAPTGAVTITGKATLGQTLTATSTLADSDGLGVLSYQWKANGEAISGQTGTTLELGQAQVGKAITVTASYTDGYITAESATSIATAAVDTVTIAKLTAFDRVTAMNSLVGAAGTGTAIYGIEAHDQQGTNLAFSLAGAVNVSGKTINDYLQLVEDDANNKATVYLRSGVSLQSLINALGGLDFSITVQDGGLTVIDPLTSVSIGGPGSDILYVASNNTAPVLSSSSNGDLIDNSGVVYQATATDTTGYGMFNYSLSGADAAFFDIDATTGAVTVKSGLTDLQTADFLTRSSYNIDVVVKDGVLGGQQSTTQSVTLNRPEVDKVGGLTVVATEANHTTNNNNAVVDVTNTAVAPNQLAAGMDLPYGKSLITATQEVDQGLVPTNISLYVDKNAGVNGFWTTINGSLVNLATAEFGGSMTEVGSQLRIDLKIDDAFDLAHSSNFVDNGVVTLNGAAAKIDLGALGANPLQANDLFWS